MIKYLVGDATEPQHDGNVIIMHICNDRGAFDAGFVVALTRKWKQTRAEYKKWFYDGEYDGTPFKLGEVQLVKVEPKISVLNMIGQVLFEEPYPPIRYDAVRECLRKGKRLCIENNAIAVMPKIGAGLAGGDWAVISKIIEEELDGIETVVYELPVIN